MPGFPDQIIIESPAQALIRGEYDHQAFSHRFFDGEQRMADHPITGQTPHQSGDLMGVCLSADLGLVGPLEFGGRDHFHGLGHLARVLERDDLFIEFLDADHI